LYLHGLFREVAFSLPFALLLPYYTVLRAIRKMWPQG